MTGEPYRHPALIMPSEAMAHPETPPPRPPTRPSVVAMPFLIALMTACAPVAATPPTTDRPVPVAATTRPMTTRAVTIEPARPVHPWAPEAEPVYRHVVGGVALPLRADGFGKILPTPPELVDRRLATADGLPPPDGDRFEIRIGPVGPEVAARSTWVPGCPVGLQDLSHLTVSFWGFDGRTHTGEVIVHRTVAEDVADVFRRLHEIRFPIEEMRVIALHEVDLPPTGDGNVTTAFVCRPAVGSSSWSRHAFGLAIDLNPFHNPYVKGDLVVPELASAYLDRTDVRPGMIAPGDEVVTAFSAIGWQWGGHWSGLADWMHFSADGR